METQEHGVHQGLGKAGMGVALSNGYGDKASKKNKSPAIVDDHYVKV